MWVNGSYTASLKVEVQKGKGVCNFTPELLVTGEIIWKDSQSHDTIVIWHTNITELELIYGKISCSVTLLVFHILVL